MPALEDNPRAAIAAGWIERRCENNRIQFQLTAEGRRRSVHWKRYTLEGLNASTESPRHARGPDDDDQEWTHWYVPVARYERSSTGDIQSADRPHRMRVLVHGRWVPNDEGHLLRQAAWAEIDVRDHEALFTLRDAGGGRYRRGAAWYLLSLRPY